MEYMTAAQAAKKWEVSVRMARRFLLDGRIQGAKRLDNGWLVPADAVKPQDLRIERKKQSNAVPHAGVRLLEEHYFEPGCVQKALSLLPEGEARQLGHAELLGLQAHTRDARAELQKLKPEPNSPRSAALLLQRAIEAVYAGDIRAWRVAYGQLTSRGEDKPAQLILAHISSVMLLPQVVPEWLKNADFDGILPLDVPFAWVVYLEYLNASDNIERLVGAAEACCALLRPCPLISSVYIKLLAAVGRQKLGDTALASAHVVRAAQMAFPDRIFGPFIELRSHLGGLTNVLSQQYPRERYLLQTEWVAYSGGWRRIYNEMTTTNVGEILTAREMDVAMLAAQGDSNRLIAEKMGVSEATVKKYLETVYQKLGVSRRQGLKFVLPGKKGDSYGKSSSGES